MSDYVELCLLGGPKDGYKVRLPVRKDGTCVPKKRVYKTTTTSSDGYYVLYAFSKLAGAYRYVARCYEDGRIPLYVESGDSFVQNVIHFYGD